MDIYRDPLCLATRRARPRSPRIDGRAISSLCILAGLVVGPRHAVGQDANAPTPPPPANRTTSEHQEDAATVAHDLEEPPWPEHGLRFDSPKHGFQSYIGGRFISDGTLFRAGPGISDSTGPLDDGLAIRRARLLYAVELNERLGIRTQIDIADGTIEARDMSVDFLNFGFLGRLRFGHVKELYGLDTSTSTKYNLFMERSLVSDAFGIGRSTGVSASNTLLGDRMTWSMGAFRRTKDFFRGEFGTAVDVNGRLTALPWYEHDGRELLHLGLSYSHRRPGSDGVSLAARPESDRAPEFVGFEPLPADRADFIGFEAALVSGPVSLQAEYHHAFVDVSDGPDVDFFAFYVQASYTLTGEHRPYNTQRGGFGRFEPRRNFGVDGGLGAWEAAVRYSHLDLNDANVEGGRLSDLTVGLNWYLNPATRVSWNYIYADAHERGVANIFQMRFQFTF